MGVRTVQRLTAELIEGGHLQVIVGHGPGRSNSYTPVLKQKNRAPVSSLEDKNTSLVAALNTPLVAGSRFGPPANGKCRHSETQMPPPVGGPVPVLIPLEDSFLSRGSARPPQTRALLWKDARPEHLQLWYLIKDTTYGRRPRRGSGNEPHGIGRSDRHCPKGTAETRRTRCR
jgi:hypothetical protein